jgi:NAD(P)-dependent dehydrogenase (short-subunit alcohol dehydrogenase family)
MQTNKIVVITGASRGIGAATAKIFAQKGYAVCINFLTDDIAAERLKQDILQYNVKCITVKADVSKACEVKRLFETVNEELGCLTVLVNNVGILQNQCRLDEIDEQRFSHVLTTNVMSCFLCSKQAVKLMSSKYGGNGGAIVNVSSGAAKSGSPNEYVDYAASKGAIDSLTKGLALEVAAEGIRVNAVRPGLIHTEIHTSGGEPNRINRLKSKIPMQRGGEPAEVAAAIYWLASENASFVTGSFVDIAG